MAVTIRRNLALHEYDVKETPSLPVPDRHGRAGGVPVVFSIRFVKKNGELVFLPSAVASGLPFHVSGNRMWGVMMNWISSSIMISSTGWGRSWRKS